MKICLYGGAFDPLHLEHINIINKLTEEFDQVIVNVSFKSDSKRFLFSFEDRLNMLNLIFINNEKVIISDVEQQINSSYTAHVVESFNNPNITIVIGSDQFNSLKNWIMYERLLTYKFLVISRNHQQVLKNSELDYSILELDTTDLSSTQIRNNILNKKDFKNYVDLRIFNYIERLKI